MYLSVEQALAEALAQVQEEIRSHRDATEKLKVRCAVSAAGPQHTCPHLSVSCGTLAQAEVDTLKTTTEEDRVEIDALTDALARAQEEDRNLRKARRELEVGGRRVVI